MKKEIVSNFDTLLAQYPSGMAVNSLLATGVFIVKQKHIVVDNDAAELIKSIMEIFLSKANAKLGYIAPTFEEYPNHFSKEN